MEPIAHIKKEMEFNKNLGNLLETMKTIAVMQFQILEKKIDTADAFLKIIEDMFVVFGNKRVRHPFIQPSVKSVGVIAITSDVGLLGGLNMQIVRGAVDIYATNPGKLVIVGKKGMEAMRSFDVPCITFPGIKDEERLEQSLQLRDFIFENVLKGEIGALKIIYPHAESFVIQKIKVINMLPFEDFPEFSDADREGIADMIYESSPSRLIEYLIYHWMGQRIYEILGWSRLAELAARYTHLEGSTQKIYELNDKLRLKYHKVRHQLIDRSLCEIFAARSIYE